MRARGKQKLIRFRRGENGITWQSSELKTEIHRLLERAFLADPDYAAGHFPRTTLLVESSGMNFNQADFLNTHIPYRLGNVELFSHALRIILSQPQATNVRVILDIGHEINGPLGIFTNGWVETGLLTCRVLINFLEAKPSRRTDDVVITMFRDRSGSNLDMVPRENIAKLHPPDITDSRTFHALNFVHQAASKRVAHLTLGEPEREEQIELCQIASIAVRLAVGHYLYERLGQLAPSSIIYDLKRH